MSKDYHNRHSVDGLTLINPFKETPEDFFASLGAY